MLNQLSLAAGICIFLNLFRGNDVLHFYDIREVSPRGKRGVADFPASDGDVRIYFHSAVSLFRGTEGSLDLFRRSSRQQK